MLTTEYLKTQTKVCNIITVAMKTVLQSGVQSV